MRLTAISLNVVPIVYCFLTVHWFHTFYFLAFLKYDKCKMWSNEMEKCLPALNVLSWDGNDMGKPRIFRTIIQFNFIGPRWSCYSYNDEQWYREKRNKIYIKIPTASNTCLIGSSFYFYSQTYSMAKC